MAKMERTIKQDKSASKAFQGALFVMNKIGKVTFQDNENLIINGTYKSGFKNIEIEISIIGLDEHTSIITINGNYEGNNSFMIKSALNLLEKGLNNVDNPKYNFKFGMSKRKITVISVIILIVIIIGAINNNKTGKTDEKCCCVIIDKDDNMTGYKGTGMKRVVLEYPSVCKNIGGEVLWGSHDCSEKEAPYYPKGF